MSWDDRTVIRLTVQGISRRKFVISSGVLIAGVAALGYNLVPRRSTNRGMIRLLPVEGVTYSESFTRFMERAKFDSVRDAIASIRDHSLPVSVGHANANDLISPLLRAPSSMACKNRRPGNSRAAEHFPEVSAVDTFESKGPNPRS